VLVHRTSYVNCIFGERDDVLGPRALAHKPSDAHLRLAVSGDRVTGRLDVAVRDLETDKRSRSAAEADERR
jgi:hypothetical protein